MLRSPTDETVAARLILSTGSRAGTEIPLMWGYYMIGRDGECQIRPKSRSVSRRHCVIHHERDVVNVFDLKSTAGTFVNADRLNPHEWSRLHDGDTLRVGKIEFQVCVSGHPPKEDASASLVAEKTFSDLVGDQGDELSEEVVDGDAWITLDVAGIFDDQDAMAEDQCDAKIRGEGTTLTVPDTEVGRVGNSDGGTLCDESPRSQGEPSQPRKKKQREAEKTYAPRKRAGGRGVRLSFSDFGSLGGADWVSRLKMIAIVILASAMLGFGALEFARVVSGPEVRVLEELDQ